MKKITFTNLNKSPMSANTPRWQTDILERVSEEYSEKAIAVSNELAEKFKEKQSRIGEGYFATAFNQLLKETPCLCYIKHISDFHGNEYEAEINLALHTVSFFEV